MKRYKLYKTLLRNYLKKLFRSSGEGFLLVGKMVLVVVTVALSVTNLAAQSKAKRNVVAKVQNLPELKMYDYLPDMVQDLPLELQYFNGKESVKTSFRALKENYVQLFFWDASYPEHLTDLKKIYDYKEEMGAFSTFILVISKKDQATLARINSALEQFKKEYGLDMDIACVIGNPNLDKLFKMDVFPKYVQINKDAAFVDEKAAEDLLKRRDSRKNTRNGK